MDELLTIARKAATQAGVVVMSHYAETAFETKDDDSPVTLADKAAHEAIMTCLLTTGIPVLSEEAEGIPLPYPERMWVIDPLDGTKGFLKKTGDFSIMIALLENGRPTIAVVDAPILKKHYYAVVGRGSYVIENDVERKLTVSDRKAPSSRGLLSVNHAAPYMFEVMKTLGVTETVSIGSIGIKAGYIGEDLADFYLTRGALGEWDVCAPELILTEAGGIVTDENGNELCYGNEDHRIKHGLILSNTTCHREVVEALAQVGS